MNEKKVDLGGYKPRETFGCFFKIIYETFWVVCSKSSLKVGCWDFLSPAHVDILLHLVNDGWTKIMLVRDLHTFPPSFCGLKIGLLQLLRFSVVWLQAIAISYQDYHMIWYDFHLTIISKHTEVNSVLVIQANYHRFFHLNQIPLYILAIKCH